VGAGQGLDRDEFACIENLSYWKSIFSSLSSFNEALVSLCCRLLAIYEFVGIYQQTQEEFEILHGYKHNFGSNLTIFQLTQ